MDKISYGYIHCIHLYTHTLKTTLCFKKHGVELFINCSPILKSLSLLETALMSYLQNKYNISRHFLKPRCTTV